MSKQAKIVGWAIILLFFFAILEMFSFFVIRNVSLVEYRTYSVPSVTQDEFDNYLETRHPMLGWPGTGWLADNTDERQARNSPANAALGYVSPCVSLFGDSFALGAEATDETAWANVLAENLGCRVDNYGIGGYGVDQAQLRYEGFLADGKDLGEVILLSIYPNDFNRNMNQWRYLLGSHPLSFKPAFRVDGDEVVLDPQFSGSLEQFIEITHSPERFLKAEKYLPDSDGFGRPTSVRFPFSWTIAKVAFGVVESIRGDAPEGYQFLMNYPTHFDDESGMSSEKQQIAEHIVSRFERSCRVAEKDCVVLLIPDSDLVFQTNKFGSHDVSKWLPEAISDATYLDATEVFADVADYCENVTQPDGCQGHFNENGYRRLAEYVEHQLVDRGLIESR